MSEHVPGRGDPADGYAPGKTSWNVIAERSVPACGGNTMDNGDSLCASALSRCEGDGVIAFWIWHQTTRVEAGPPETRTITVPWHQEDGYFCLGADDPEVAPIARVLDQVQTDFQHLPLRSAVVRTDPGPTTLVNLDTAFSAGAAAPQTFDPVLLGVPVHITATPVRWIWAFGDGSSATTTTPGTPRRPDVTHRYSRTGDLRASVTVEWTGTFRVGSDPTEHVIRTPARVAGQPVAVQVREARSQLVSR